MKIGIFDDDIAFLNHFKERLSIKHDVIFAEEHFDILKLKKVLPEIELVFVDLVFPSYSGIEIIEYLKKNYPKIEIVVLSIVENEKALLDSIKAGASGYIIKNDLAIDLSEAVNIQIEGGAMISGKMARYLLHNVGPIELEEDKKLSDLQKNVLKQLASGHNYKTVAFNLGISLNGLRYHIKKIYRTLGVQSSTQALNYYYKNRFDL